MRGHTQTFGDLFVAQAVAVLHHQHRTHALGQPGQYGLQALLALLPLGAVFDIVTGHQPLRELFHVLDAQRGLPAPRHLLARQIDRHGIEIRFRVGDGLARLLMRTQQAQIGFLDQVFGVLVCSAAHEEAAQHRAMLGEQTCPGALWMCRHPNLRPIAGAQASGVV